MVTLMGIGKEQIPGQAKELLKVKSLGSLPEHQAEQRYVLENHRAPFHLHQGIHRVQGEIEISLAVMSFDTVAINLPLDHSVGGQDFGKELGYAFLFHTGDIPVGGEGNNTKTGRKPNIMLPGPGAYWHHRRSDDLPAMPFSRIQT
jgi:hypothetical protein